MDYTYLLPEICVQLSRDSVVNQAARLLDDNSERKLFDVMCSCKQFCPHRLWANTPPTSRQQSSGLAAHNASPTAFG